LQAIDRQGLLRDITELLAREKMNVIGVNTQSVKGGGAQADIAWMTFTIEMTDTQRLPQVLGTLRGVKGVRSAQRRQS
jgi:GTP pyrophosphokinase